MATLAERLVIRIAQVDAQIQRTKDDALAAVAELQDVKATLLRAQAALAKTPEAEQLIPALAKLGLLP